jgi:hypothetical protein
LNINKWEEGKGMRKITGNKQEAWERNAAKEGNDINVQKGIKEIIRRGCWIMV